MTENFIIKKSHTFNVKGGSVMVVKTYLTDLEIASEASIKPITEIAEKAGIPEDAVEQYGRYKAKIDPLKISTEANAKVVLVTAINPTQLAKVNQR